MKHKQLMTSTVFVILMFFMSGCDIFRYSGDSVPIVTATDTPEIASTEPPDLVIITDGAEIAMDRGTYCWTGGNGTPGLCADYLPFVYEPDNHSLVSNTEMTLEFGQPTPDRISVSLVSGSSMISDGERLELDSVVIEDSQFTVVIPDNLSGLYVLLVFAVWDDEPNQPSGDAAYSAPLAFE